jgi:hypothetical protein
MCYAKPGPRCSTHAKASLDKAHADLAVANETRNAQSKFMQTMPLEERRPFLNDPDGDYRKSIRNLDHAHEALVAAENGYDATPAGMTALKEQMAALEEQRGRIQARESVPYTNLAQRLERAQETRRNQMEAYKAIHGTATPATGETVDDAAAEAAAMAPPPACMCITYKYQSDCEHVSPKLSAHEVEQARKDLLPTTEEASVRLHAANARVRSLTADLTKWQAWLAEDPARTIQLSGLGGMPTKEARENPAFAKFEDDYNTAKREAVDAETAFYKTPGGQAYMRQRSAESVARMGYHTGASQADFARAIEGDEERIAARKSYTLRTGQPAPPEETNPQPPTLMYGNGCPDNCHDFAWTGKCADTDTEMGQTRALQDAFSGSGQMRSLSKKMDKAFNPKPAGRLARLLGRNKAAAPTDGMSPDERSEYAVRMEYRIRKAENALDDNTARALRTERDRMLRTQ